MKAATIPAEVTRFAAQVRAELADLGRDDLEDLTDGLEADIAESLEEDPTRDLPDPVAYASELRTAAGLPLRPEPGRGVRGALRGITSGLRDTGHQVAESLRGHPVTASMLGFLDALRPTWWVLRAWVAYWLLAAFFGSEAGFAPTGLWWLVLLGFIVISVQLGRGRWRAKGVPTFVLVGNLAAAVLAIPVLFSAGEWHGPAEAYVDAVPASPGVSLDGVPVSNIYAYGPDGKPLTGVQLFDQDGNPLAIWQELLYTDCVDVGCEESGLVHPDAARLETGELAENVFPLRLGQEPPFVKVPRVEQAEKVE